MAQDDDLVHGVEQQFKVIQAARARCEADLAEYRADGNTAGIAEELQTIANLDNSARNLSNLVERHARSQQPAAPIPQTPEELRVKPAEKMTWQDGLDVAINGSKYGKGLDFNDPNVRRGYAEVMRRRSAGENQS
jgi:hypothetical protein